MAVDMFLKITGIEGESADAKHKGSIDVESFSWGATNPGAASVGGGGGAGAGKVSMQDFNFVMRANKASPKLFLAAANGQHIKEALLTARKSGGKEQVEFYKVKMTDILVSSYQQAGSGDGQLDSFSLNFAKIEVEYVQLGRPEASKAGWDVTRNKEL